MKKKIKINLSHECVNKLTNAIDYGSAESREELNEMMRVAEDLRWAEAHRDERGRLLISRETLDYIIADLDWAYCNG